MYVSMACGGVDVMCVGTAICYFVGVLWGGNDERGREGGREGVNRGHVMPRQQQMHYCMCYSTSSKLASIFIVKTRPPEEGTHPKLCVVSSKLS